MKTVSGLDIQIDVPDGASDNSTLCFLLPDFGDRPPSLVIRNSQEYEEKPDLVERLSNIVVGLEASQDNFVQGEVRSGKRGDWDYAIVSLQWGTGDDQVSQKQLLIHIELPIKRTLHIIAEDFTKNFAQSEPIFNDMMRSIEPAKP